MARIAMVTRAIDSLVAGVLRAPADPLRLWAATACSNGARLRSGGAPRRAGLGLPAGLAGVMLLASGPFVSPAAGQCSVPNYATDTSPCSIAINDFDSDGVSDLAVANFFGSSVSVLLGNSNGTFGPATDYNTGKESISIAVSDFNTDGKPDLAVLNYNYYSWSFEPGSVSILLGNGDGTFQPAANFDMDGASYCILARDLNADARADLAVVNEIAGTVSILLGNGDGSFQPAVKYYAGGNPYFATVADFNADGAADLAVTASFGSSEISILLGNGDGSFQAPVFYTVGSNPLSIAVGDFNTDGRFDLATADFASSSVSVLLGNGNGTFQPAVAYSVGIEPSNIAGGDLNGDGKLDLATSNTGSDDISVLLGNGDGSFQAAINHCVGDHPYDVEWGDFDGDGRFDLVAANQYSNNVSVLLNTAFFSDPANILAFGLEHEPLNGATLEIDVDGNLVVNSGAGPGAGEEDVSVHIGDGAGLSYAVSPDSDLSQLGQEVTCTMRGEVDGVPDTLVARSKIAGTGTSALLTVDFPLAASEGQRARLYDDQNRLIASVIVPNATPFTLTSPLRATISSTRSNAKGGLSIDGGGELVQPEHVEEFASDLNVTHASLPGESWPKVRKVAIQSASKQGQPIRGVDVNLGKKPASGSLIIKEEGPDLVVPGSPKGLAAFSTTGLTTITPLPDAVVLTEPPGGGPGLFSIADRGLPGELRRGKKRATVEMEPPVVGTLADGAYLKTTSHILVKGKQCPPNCFDVSVTETKVPGSPLPVQISADFTDLGSTTHRVTVLLDGVVLGVHSGVGSVIGYAEEFATARDVSPATPITRGPLDPLKGISIGIIKKPPPSIQISGTPYTADEIRIEPEFPIETVEAIDDVSLQSQGLGSVIVTGAGFEDAALLVGGLPVSLAGTEAELDLDTRDELALTNIGSSGQDGYTVDLGVGMPGYATEVPRLPAGGTSEGRYDLDVTTATVSMLVAPAGGGDDLSFEPIMVGGTYDLYAYKRRLKIFSDDDRSGEAVVLAGGTRPVPMEQFIAEVDGTTYAVVALSISADTGAAIIDGQAIDADEVQVWITLPPGVGAAIRKLDYRLTTDRADAVVHAAHALLGPGGIPIAGLGEARLTDIDATLGVTGLGSTGQDGFALGQVTEKDHKQWVVLDGGWQSPDPSAPAGSSITATASFAGLLDPSTTFAAKKKDKKRLDSRFDMTADFTAIGSPTVHVEVLSGGVPVAQLPGHSPDIGIAQTAPIGAGAGTVWRLGGEGACVSSTYPPATEFIIDGQTYIGDQLVLGAEGRAATDLLVSLGVTTVGYERLLIGEFTSEPLPICYADLNGDGLVDFADYLEFLNLFDAQSPYVDFNQDGLVDFADYLEFLNYYDAGC